MGFPASLRAAALAVAVLLPAACTATAPGRGTPASPASRHPARPATLAGPGITVLTCPSVLRRIDPATGRTRATRTYDPNALGPGPYTADCGSANRTDVRESFSPDFMKAVTMWQTGSGAVAGYVTPDGRKKAVFTVRSHEQPGLVSQNLKWPRFDPRSGDLWSARLTHEGLDDTYVMSSRSVTGGKAVPHGSCDNCQGFAVAWPTGWVIPDGDQHGPARRAALVTADGRTAYVPMTWGFGEKSGLRPWRKGTRFDSSPDQSGGDIPHDLPCDPVDLLMTDQTHALCAGLDQNGIGRLTIDPDRRTVQVRNLLPHPPGKATDPVLSPDGKQVAFIVPGDTGTRLYITPLTGPNPRPRLVATIPSDLDSPARLLAWT